MRPVAILQNDPIVPPGTVIDYFDERKIAYKLIKTYADENWGLLETFRALIVLGSSHSAIFYSQSEHLVKLFGFVREAVSRQFPVLGICFGSQLLAMTLGAEVTRGVDMELGQAQVKLTDFGKEDPIFREGHDELTIFHWHRDRWKLPDKAELLASNEVASNQAFRSGKAVGLQFHPEVNREIVESWCEAFADDVEANQTSAAEIVGQYAEMAEALKKLNYQILDGFLSSAPTK